jgi:hypothetical protein
MYSGIVASVQRHGTQGHLRLLGLDTKDDELLALQPLAEAVLVEQVLLAREANLPVSLVGNPLPRPLGVQLRQVLLERLQGPPFQRGQFRPAHDRLLSRMVANAA